MKIREILRKFRWVTVGPTDEFMILSNEIEALNNKFNEYEKKFQEAKEIMQCGHNLLTDHLCEEIEKLKKSIPTKKKTAHDLKKKKQAKKEK